MDFEDARQMMIDLDLRGRGLGDERVLAAMASVPRERFVDPELATHAYRDIPLPIEAGQTISQPYIVALMAEALLLSPTDRVLDIGTGSGYAAAVLAELCAEVFSIERHEPLATAAANRLEALRIDNVVVRCGDGTLGWPEAAPFDAIVVAAGAPRIPPALVSQLAVGGRLVLPVGATQRRQELVRVTREPGDVFLRECLGAVRFVPLIGDEAWSGDDDKLAALL